MIIEESQYCIVGQHGNGGSQYLFVWNELHLQDVCEHF